MKHMLLISYILIAYGKSENTESKVIRYYLRSLIVKHSKPEYVACFFVYLMTIMNGKIPQYIDKIKGGPEFFYKNE